jgi:hypothetical protein
MIAGSSNPYQSKLTIGCVSVTHKLGIDGNIFATARWPMLHVDSYWNGASGGGLGNEH